MPSATACAALRTMLSTACVSCSGSASNSGMLMSKSVHHADRRELGLHDAAHAHEDLVDVGAPVRRQPAAASAGG